MLAFYTRKIVYCLFVCLFIGLDSCASDEQNVEDENTHKPIGKDVYIPEALKDNDFTKESSQWSWSRSKASENWVVFWEAGFGKDPGKALGGYAVDINDLLDKAESIYKYYANTLKFIDGANSKTSQYRMMISLSYNKEWSATGAGYDDVIGALWVNAPAVQPVGSVVAHEIGHCFQYQVYCDNPTSDSGYRYGFGPNGEGGNAFWEQCAQWQSFKIYPEEQFSSYYYGEYLKYFHKNILHETPSYSNYFIQDYWCMKHGIDFIGKLWRMARKPEDPVDTYKRITNIDQATFNDEMFDAARRFVNWDVDGIRDYGKNYVGRKQASLLKEEDGYYRISPDQCIENYGYNVIDLNRLAETEEIKADFEGIVGADGYRSLNADEAGWRYGFVAYLNDGTCVYSNIFSEPKGSAVFNCPSNCKKLYFVVSGAPKVHWHHVWDDDDSNDEQWPYKVKFEGASVLN